MKTTKIPNKKILKVQYQKYTQDELANRYGVARTTIQNWVRKHGLSGQSKRGGHNIIKFCTAQELRKMYLMERLSSIEIGKKFGVDRSVVLNRLKKYGIKRRSASEARRGKYDGENCPSFRGAIYKTPSGYYMKKLLLAERGKHRCDGAHRVYVHTYRMEKYIGRKLKKDEVVHHVDLDRQNNNISNLILFPNQAEHIRFHKHVEKLGLHKMGVLKKRPHYKLPREAVVPEECKISI